MAGPSRRRPHDGDIRTVIQAFSDLRGPNVLPCHPRAAHEFRSGPPATIIQRFPTLGVGVNMTVLRSALEIAGIVVSCLLVVVGGGLTGDPVVLMMIATGMSLSLMFAALAERWWKSGRVPTG